MRVRLKKMRADKGWTQQETASHLGISIDMVKSMEMGRVGPSLDTAVRMKQVFGCNCIDELIENAC